MSFLLNSFQSLINSIFIILPTTLIAIMGHEFAHGLVSVKLGDPTPKYDGRLSFNPLKHLDPLGTVLMLLTGFGWAKPVPVNMNNFKNPKSGMAITALAGPVSNLLLATVVLIIFGFVYFPLTNAGSVGAILLEMLRTTAYLSCMLAVFNIIPIPPLDGSKILFSLLPEREYYKLMQYERFGMIILVIIILSSFLRGQQL